MDNKTRELAFRLGNGYCMCSKECTERATDLHHKLSNSKVNKKTFPLFIDSIFNLLPIYNGCHLSKPIPKISINEAAVYEEWLQEFTNRSYRS